jgi:hypothetical protein
MENIEPSCPLYIMGGEIDHAHDVLAALDILFRGVEGGAGLGGGEHLADSQTFIQRLNALRSGQRVFNADGLSGELELFEYGVVEHRRKTSFS